LNYTTVPSGQGWQKLNKKGSVGKNWKLLPKGIENKIKQVNMMPNCKKIRN
jgi:hypothetical protein